MVFKKADCLSTKHICLALPKVQGLMKLFAKFLGRDKYYESYLKHFLEITICSRLMWT